MAPIAPLLGTIFTGVSTGFSVISAIHQANAQADAQDEAARVAERNATLEREKAADDEKQFRVFSRKAMGDMRTGYAASGVSIDGTVGDVLSESASMAEFDALKIRRGGELRAQGYADDASFLKKAAGSTRAGGYLSGIGTGFAGAAKTAGYLDDYLNPKATKSQIDALMNVKPKRTG